MSRSLPGPPVRQPIQAQNGRLTSPWQSWFIELFLRVGQIQAPTNAELGAMGTGVDGRVVSLEASRTADEARLTALEALPANQPLPSYTVATVPSASANARKSIYVSDEVGGATPAFSDGVSWRRFADRGVIS